MPILNDFERHACRENAGKPADRLPVPVELIARQIYNIRSQKVMLDADLAELYNVETRVLNRPSAVTSTAFPKILCFK